VIRNLREALADAFLDRLVAENPDLFHEDSGDDTGYAVEVVIHESPGLRISVLFRDARQS